MKTSKLVLRPFMPVAEKIGTEFSTTGKREPYATLTYGNVTIQLDYTIFRLLEIETKYYHREREIFNLGKEEILHEMAYDSEGLNKPRDTDWFRDNPDKCSIKHRTSPLAYEDDNWTSKIDGSRTMVWDKLSEDSVK